MKLIEKINGQLYSVRPRYISRCPYCFKAMKNPANNRALGFYQVAFRRHVFSCFEKALKLEGYVESEYDSTIDRFKIKRIDETAPTNP